MPARSLEACFFVSKSPKIEFRDEVFMVTYEVGKCRFEFALPPKVYMEAFGTAAELANNYAQGRGTVLSLVR